LQIYENAKPFRVKKMRFSERSVTKMHHKSPHLKELQQQCVPSGAIESKPKATKCLCNFLQNTENHRKIFRTIAANEFSVWR
jgi:hypothetical protein